jgi:hypothetical protein
MIFPPGWQVLPADLAIPGFKKGWGFEFGFLNPKRQAALHE